MQETIFQAFLPLDVCDAATVEAATATAVKAEVAKLGDKKKAKDSFGEWWWC